VNPKLLQGLTREWLPGALALGVGLVLMLVSSLSTLVSFLILGVRDALLFALYIAYLIVKMDVFLFVGLANFVARKVRGNAKPE
jgi:hypothetical protein